MAWIKIPTPLKSGPLNSDSYTINITGLSASTKYCYRAYFIVDGVEYYGDILSGTTSSISYTAPKVNTGLAYLDDDNPDTVIKISGNCITDNGCAPILEYGVLYTNLAQYGTTLKLVLSNYPQHINKKALCDDALMNPFFIDNPSYYITELTPSTTYFYRAYAKNAMGTSYGQVKYIVTSDVPTISVDVNVNWGGSNNLSDGFCGNYKLYCYDHTLVKSCCVDSITHSSISSWTVPKGYYYVDFSGLEAYVGGSSVPYEFYVSTTLGYLGLVCTTTNFNSDIIIYGAVVPQY